jgi:hypothetical protein
VTESLEGSMANVDDVILEEVDQSIDSEMFSFIKYNFSDLKGYRARHLEYTKAGFLFYQWDVYKDKIQDPNQFLKHGPTEDTGLLFWLLQYSPVNNMSGQTFTNQ